MINYYTIGQRVKEARKKKHLSQADLAEAVEKSTSYISYMETGLKCMSLETLVGIANALDVSADYILADCINTHENVCENEFAEQIKECTLYESRIIIDMVKALREILRENAFTKRNSK